MISTMFETYSSYGPDEFLTISDTKYNNNTVIDTILPTNFTVAFHPGGTSWKGFVLNWKCLSQWEEWTPLGDGTCREVMGTQPPYNGPDFTYRTKYRRNNETCSMLYIYIHIEVKKFILIVNKRLLSISRLLFNVCMVHRIFSEIILFNIVETVKLMWNCWLFDFEYMYLYLNITYNSTWTCDGLS